MGNALRFWSSASGPYVIGMWHVTGLLLAVGGWCGLELARARQLLKVPLLAVASSSAVMLLLPLFVTAIEIVRLFTVLYVVLLGFAIGLAAPHRRAIAGISMLLVWVNVGTLLTALLWGV
jgi:hypothetical protein